MNPSNSSMQPTPVNNGRRIATQNMAAVYAELDAAAHAARFGQRSVQPASAQTDAQAASNQQLQQAVNNAPPVSPATTTTTTTTTTAATNTTSQSTQPTASWIKALLNPEKSGVSPLNQSILNGDTELAHMLLSHGASVSAHIAPFINNSQNHIEALFHQNAFDEEEKRNELIVNLALHKFNIAPAGNLHYIGANAVTLAILCKAHPAFFVTLCTQAKKQDQFILDRVDGAGHTPLCVAISNQNMNLLRVLLNAGANVNGHYKGQASPLLTAAHCSNNEACITLLKAGAKTGVPEGAKSALQICYDNKNFAIFEKYQAVSPAHKREVFQFLCKQARQVLSNGTENDLHDFLECVKKVLTDERLLKLGVIAAKTPGAKTKLMIILMMMKKKPSVTQCLALRLAAAKSADEDTYSYVKTLSESSFANALSNPLHDAQQQAQFSRELAQALKTKNRLWMQELLSQGAVFDPMLPAFNKYPLISQLADLGEEHLLLDYLPTTQQWTQQMSKVFFDNFISQPPADFMCTHTALGLYKLLSHSIDFLRRLSQDNKFELLIHAVKLHSYESIKLLLVAGGFLNPSSHFAALMGLPDAVNTPIKEAIKNNNQDMVEFLLEHGAIPNISDVHQAENKFSRKFVQKLLSASLSANNE